MTRAFFVTGIGTEIGKTVVSSILVEALGADYWKPVQAGDLDYSDTMKVKNLVSNSRSDFHPERYRLTQPMSPHAAAAIDGVAIQLTDFHLPNTRNNLIVEGAGGLMVPLNQQDCMIDLIRYLNIPVVLVSQNYLGSINHTLLSIKVLEMYGVPIQGLIFNGEKNSATEQIIEKMGKVKILGRVAAMTTIDKNAIRQAAATIDIKGLINA